MYEQKIIFILGTGRSGTHMIGYTLQNHNQINASIEKPKIFKKVTSMALNKDIRPKLFPKLIKLYNKEIRRAYPKHYLDKSHPNIWLAEALANIYSSANFIIIRRNPYATISSMLMHKGILQWQENWQDFPVPNEFLGIDKRISNEYKKYSMTKRCALRWLSHERRIAFLKKILNNRLTIIRYEDFVINTSDSLKYLKDFLGLRENIPLPKIKKDSLNKWKKYLNQKQIDEIKQVTQITPENALAY